MMMMMMMMIYLSEGEKKVEPILQSESGALFTLDTKFFPSFLTAQNGQEGKK